MADENLEAHDWDGVRRVIWQTPLDEMEIIGNRFFSVAVPTRADAEFKAYVYAAGVTHSMGNVCIDPILRRNRSEWIRRFARGADDGSTARLLDGVRDAALKSIDHICSLDLTAAQCGAASAANVLIRLATTFRGASQLVRLGFAFEAQAVIRLGLEQVCWAHAVVNHDSADDIDSTSVTKSISSARSLLPGVGRAYGRLSELAHVDPRVHGEFIREEGDHVKVILTSDAFVEEALLYYLLLLDAFLIVCESAFRHFGMPIANIDPASGLGRAPRTLDELFAQHRERFGIERTAELRAWAGREVGMCDRT